jgi:LmbE family N-acetylglucosaminyl deacetylase
MRTVNVISPHPDDAALSLCKTLAKWIELGWKVRIISCFTITSWAPLLPEISDVASVSAIRRREELDFIARFNGSASLVSLDYLDAPLRPDWSIKDHREIRRSYCRQHHLVNDVSASLREHSGDCAVWVLPLAAGLNQDALPSHTSPLSSGHRDHLIALLAGLNYAKNRPALFYEDVPYSLEYSLEELALQIRGIERSIGKSLTRLRHHDDFSASSWMDYVSDYSSQFSADYLYELATRMELRGGERMWGDESATSLLCG